MIAVLLNDHSAALISSVAWNARLLGRAHRPGGRLGQAILLSTNSIMPLPVPRIQHLCFRLRPDGSPYLVCLPRGAYQGRLRIKDSRLVPRCRSGGLFTLTAVEGPPPVSVSDREICHFDPFRFHPKCPTKH